MAKPLKLIIFDCDGTLVDSQHIIVAAMTRAYAFHGLSPPERAVLLSVVGLSIVEAFTKLGNGAAGFPASGLAEQYRLASRAIRESGQEIEPLYPGAADAIAELARRDEIVLGIATGKSQRGVRLVLGHHGLLDRFITIQTADDAPSKPDPGMVLAAMRDAGAAPENTIVVGDTVYDMAMARAAGAAGVGVTWGYHPGPALAEAGALAVIVRFANLVPTLDRIWAT
jgi:phosphoglycolate phosphatase